MQIFSNVGQDEAEKVRGEVERLFGTGVKVPTNPIEFQEFNFGHDVRVDSRAALEQLGKRRSGKGDVEEVGGHKADVKTFVSEVGVEA